MAKANIPDLNLVTPDLRQEVKNYLPILFDFVPEKNRTWGQAQKLFKAEVEKRYLQAEGDVLEIEANLYFIIDKAKKGNQQAARLLHFFEKLLEEMLMYMDQEEVPKIRNSIKNILLNLDHKYLNFFGEIAVLNNLMKTKLYLLEAVEAALPDSTNTIDFKIRNKNTNNILLVEVYNLHPKSDKIDREKEKIDKYLSGNFKKKIDSKKTSVAFYLVPVIWGGIDDLKIYSDFFTHYQLPIAGLIEPSGYATFVSPEDESIFIHRFGRLSSLFGDDFGQSHTTSYQ